MPSAAFLAPAPVRRSSAGSSWLGGLTRACHAPEAKSLSGACAGAVGSLCWHLQGPTTSRVQPLPPNGLRTFVASAGARGPVRPKRAPRMLYVRAEAPEPATVQDSTQSSSPVAGFEPLPNQGDSPASSKWENVRAKTPAPIIETAESLAALADISEGVPGLALDSTGHVSSSKENPDLGKRVAGGLALFAASGLGVAATLAIQNADKLESYLSELTSYVDQLGPLGPAAYGAAYVVLEILALPAIPFTLTAGFLFGPVVGTATISVAATVAASLSFLIGRYLARDYVFSIAKKYKQFLAIDHAIKKESFKVVALLRLSPLLPFSISNYLYGLTSVEFTPYVFASWLGMLPGTIAYVYTGSVGKMALGVDQEGSGGVNPLLVGLGLAATVGVIALISRVAKDALHEADPELETEEPVAH